MFHTEGKKKNDSVFLFSNKLLQVGFITTILGHADTQCPQALQCHQSHALLRGVRRGLPHPQPPVPHWGSTPGLSLCPPSSVQYKDGSCSESCTDNKNMDGEKYRGGEKKSYSRTPSPSRGSRAISVITLLLPAHAAGLRTSTNLQVTDKLIRVLMVHQQTQSLLLLPHQASTSLDSASKRKPSLL